MHDPAWGASRAYKSGVMTDKLNSSTKMTGAQWRNINVGMYSGPRPSYQRYTVGANSSDILNRSKRNKDMR
jgi:uncharacterized protein (DUF39 family)